MALLASLVRWTARGTLILSGIYLCLVLLVASEYSILLLTRWMNDPPKGESHLWRINGSPPSYLYGTVHIPYDLIWPSVPQNTKEAFEVN